jgi:molybdopterin converting factor small subunit
MRKERLINLTKEKGMNNIMNSSVKRVMKNLKDNETINAFGEVVEKGAGDYGNHFHQLDLFKESIKEIQNEMDEFFSEMDKELANG